MTIIKYTRKFEELLAKDLHAAGIPFKQEVVLGGLQPDFLIQAPDGRKIVLEAKTWNPHGSNRRRAIEWARLYKKATGADRAFIVLEGLKRKHSRPSKGLVSEKDVVDVLSAELEKKVSDEETPPVPPPTKGKPRSAKRQATRMVFAAMPFSPEYDDVYFVAMAPAAQSVNAACKRVDREEFQGDIVVQIEELIASSQAVIADLSESRANVLYETGFAHALKLPIIHICSTPLDELPFDVRNWNTISYVKGRTHKLQGDLARRLKGVLET